MPSGRNAAGMAKHEGKFGKYGIDQSSQTRLQLFVPQKSPE